MSDRLRLVLSTCGSREIADAIAHALVERKLAACVNVIPGVSSTYRWDGKIERDEEVLLIIKTEDAQVPVIESEIKTLANYELPELVAVDITGGAADYLGWVAASVGEASE